MNYTYKVMFTWKNKLGNQYQFIEALNGNDAKKRVEMMYNNQVKAHWAEKQN